MRFLLLTEAPGVETDYGTCAIVDLSEELIALIQNRRKMLAWAAMEDKSLVELHFDGAQADLYDGIPKSMKVPKAVQKKLDESGIAELPLSVKEPDPEKDVTTPTDVERTIITETGVAWCFGLKHLSFYAFTREIPYKLFLPEAA